MLNISFPRTIVFSLFTPLMQSSDIQMHFITSYLVQVNQTSSATLTTEQWLQWLEYIISMRMKQWLEDNHWLSNEIKYYSVLLTTTCWSCKSSSTRRMWSLNNSWLHWFWWIKRNNYANTIISRTSKNILRKIYFFLF